MNIKKIIAAIAFFILAAFPLLAVAQSSLGAGGTGWSTSTTGDLLVGTSSTLRYSRLPIGTTDFLLKSSSTSPFKMEWVATSTLGFGTGNAILTWLVGNGFIYNATTSDLIGIGTTTPYNTLDILGKGGVMPLRVSSSTGSSMFEIEQNGNIGINNSNAQNPLSFSSGGLKAFSSVGLTGITITTTNSDASSSIVSVGSGAVSDSSNFFLMRPAGSIFSGSLALRANGSGNANTGTSLSLIPSALLLTSQTDFTNGMYLGTQTGNLTFFASTTNPASTTMTISNIGNVGIGTTSPSNLFHVSGNQSGRIALFERINPVTTGILGTLTVKGHSTGEIQNNFGSAITFAEQGGTSTESLIADIAAVRNGADNTGYLLLRPYTLGSATWPGITIDGSALSGSVGTTTSGATWGIVGTSSKPTLALLSVASSSGSVLFSLAANGSTTISNLACNGQVVTTTSAGSLFCTPAAAAGSGNAAWTIGSGLIYNATSTDLVGIGTSTPSTTLFIQGKGTVNPFVVASSTGTQMLTLARTGKFGINNSSPVVDVSLANGGINSWPLNSGGVILTNTNGNAISLFSNSQPADYTIFDVLRPGGSTDAGDVQFYSLGPSYASSGLFTASTGFLIARSDFTGGLTIGSEGGNVRFSSGGLAASNIVQTITTGGLVGIGTTTPTTTLFVQGKAGTNPFAIASSTGTNMINVFQNGGVGIATSSQQGAFLTIDKVGSALPGIRVYSNSGGSGNIFEAYSTAGALQLNINSNGGLNWSNGANGSTLILTPGNTANNPLVVNGASLSQTGDLVLVKKATSGSDVYFDINANGNIGVGTGTPIAKFAILGTTTAGTTNLFTAASSSGSQVFTVDPDGRTGINFATPCSVSPSGFTVNSKTGCLEIRSKDATGNIIFGMRRSDNGTGFEIINDTGVDGHTQFNNEFNSNGLSYLFNTKTLSTPVPAISVFGNGRVGLGTTTPQARFFIDGQSTTEAGNLVDVMNSTGAHAFTLDNGNMYSQWYANGGCNNLSLGFNKGVGMGTCGTASTSSLTLGTNNTAYITILNGGNVGVGTTTPVSTLSASGTVTFVNLATQAIGDLATCIGLAGGVHKSVGTDCTVSDERQKHTIDNLSLGLETLRRFKPISYLWNGTNVSGISASTAQVAYAIDPRFANLYLDGPDKGTPASLDHQAIEGLITNSVLQLDEKVSKLESKENPSSKDDHIMIWIVISIMIIWIGVQQAQISKLKSTK